MKKSVKRYCDDCCCYCSFLNQRNPGKNLKKTLLYLIVPKYLIQLSFVKETKQDDVLQRNEEKNWKKQLQLLLLDQNSMDSGEDS